MSEKSFISLNGFKYPIGCTEETVNYAINYKPLNEDKFIITYPKCGTTWTQQIIYLIRNDGNPEMNNKEFIYNTYLEFKGEQTVKKPIIKTHLPFNALPFNESAKYLLVFRNPKDTVVSYYYHLKAVPHFEMNLEFHDFFKEWMNGQIASGDYFDYLEGYWPHRSEHNFHYLIYEQMKRNPRDAVLKIANFLGQEFVDRITDNNELILNKVLKYSTVDSMKSDANLEDFIVRKGIVGDWRTHLTREESDLIDRKVDQYFSAELLNIWKEDMKWI